MKNPPLPNPTPERGAALEWVGQHLSGLYSGPLTGSGRFVGGQNAADKALSDFDVSGYAAKRNEVWPERRRGASALSPYIRHGLLPLPRVWQAVAGGPARDVSKFRDELLWQEYARHLYARLGLRTRTGLRAELWGGSGDGWDQEMACVGLAVDELEEDGWLVNQTRMWLASQWAVRERVDWRDGEDHFFRHLLDGSRAANRLGWQWVTGIATKRTYGFSRWQVEKRAPGLCEQCRYVENCPIEEWPSDPDLNPVDPDPRLKADSDPTNTAGPASVVQEDDPHAVWLTAESLGRDDPALSANPELDVVFVFDEPLLTRLQLSAKRLVFLVETLAEISESRALEIHRGSPSVVLQGRPLATTFAPVPGWQRHAAVVSPVEVHPWPWLKPPHGGSVASFSAWRKGLRQAG